MTSSAGRAVALDLAPVCPTIRCLREDLGIARLPPASRPLHAFGHLLLQKAQGTFAAADVSAERIASLDDRVFLKAKVGRWRGAVWRDLPAQWLCAAGQRQDGSPDDSYERLAERRRA